MVNIRIKIKILILISNSIKVMHRLLDKGGTFPNTIYLVPEKSN